MSHTSPPYCMGPGAGPKIVQATAPARATFWAKAWGEAHAPSACSAPCPPAGSAPAFQLMMLGQSMVPMLQRFYLVIALLVRNGSGTLSREKLEGLCQKSAQRLAMIYGLHSPDFFDKALFQDFIRTLREREVVRRNEAGFLVFGDDIKRIGEDARLVLGEEIRHSILSLTFSGPGFDRL